MADNELTLGARVSVLETQVAELKGANDQINRSIAAVTRMTIWQFLGFVFVMAGTLFGTLYWATGVLERRIEQSEKNFNDRFGQNEKNFNDRFGQMEKRFEQMEKRFEDLRQVVLSRPKQASLPQGLNSPAESSKRTVKARAEHKSRQANPSL